MQADLKRVMGGYPAVGGVPTWAQLQSVAYLQAVIKEGLRYVDEDPSQRGGGVLEQDLPALPPPKGKRGGEG